MNGSLDIYGTVRVDRESSGAGELVVTSNNGSGETHVRDGGTLEINQLGGGTPTVSTFTLLNEGTVNIGGATLNLTASGTQESDNGDASTGTINFGDGTLDADHRFNNNTGSTLSFSSGTFEAGFTFSNDGSIQRNSDATVDFDGTSGTTSLLGDFSSANNNTLGDVTVRQNVVVDPGDALSNSGNGEPVVIKGSLTIESGGRFGEKTSGGTFQEGADLRYDGTDFSVAGQLFINRVNFASDQTTTVTGSVFGEVSVGLSTVVQVGDQNFTVFGLVEVTTNATLDVADKQLVLNGDVLVDGSFLATSGTVKFQGTGRKTCCSLDGGELDKSNPDNVQQLTGNANVNFGTLTVADTTNDNNTTPETDVKIPSSASVTNIQGDFTVDEANFTTDRPLTLEGFFTVEPDANFDISGNNLLTFSGGNLQEVTLPEPLTLRQVELDKSSGTVDLKSDLIISDTLRMSRGILEPNAKLSINERLALEGGTIDISGGTGSVVLVSDGSNDAYIRYSDSNGDNTVDGSVNGDITFQRELDGSADEWYYMASPADDGSNNDTFEDFFENGGQNDLWTQGVPGADEEPGNSSAANLYGYSENQDLNKEDKWVPIPGMTSTMASGKGYIIYVFEDDNVDGTAQSAGLPKVIDSDVTPRTGTVFDFATDGPLSANDQDGDGVQGDPDEGWNLLGNPYMTTIDFCASAIDTTDIKPTVELWDPQNGGYANYNCDTGSSSGTNGGLDNGFIAPHQAFFVKATSESPSLKIDDITDAQANTSGFFQKATPNQEKPPAVKLEFSLGGHRYATSVGFLEGRTTGLDHSDGYYFGGSEGESGPSFYTLLSDGTAITTNAMPRELSEEKTIPLHVDACNYGTALSGTASITWPTMRNLPDSWGLVLEDTETDTLVDLKEASKYEASVTGICPKGTSTSDTDKPKSPSPGTIRHVPPKNSEGPDTRFKLHIKPDAALPVEFSGVNGRSDGEDAILEWETASETNNAGFQIQRKVEGSYTDLDDAFVESKATGGTTDQSTNYRYRVSDLDAGEYSFRLKQVDTDGTTSFSDPIDVEVGVSGKYDFTTYPNPVRNRATVKFALEDEAEVTLALYNTLGQRVRTIYRDTPPAEQTQEIRLNTDGLSSGLYILRLKGSGITATQRVTVVK